MIRSYELSVLVAPRLPSDSYAMVRRGGGGGVSGASGAASVPFAFPPRPYLAADRPWTVDGAPDWQPDVNGLTLSELMR